MMSGFLRWLTAGFILALVGCSSPQVVKLVTQEGGWHMRGRIAIYHEADVWNASIDWLQQGADFYLQLSGPLGQGIARLQGNDFGVSLQHPDGRKLFAQDADALLEAETGMKLPIAGLRYWVVAKPLPSVKHDRLLDDEGRLARISQSGWIIEYKDYMDGSRLPRKVELSNAVLRVKLVVDSWENVMPHG